jgi:acetyl esterase
MSGERAAAPPALSGEVLRYWREHVLREPAGRLTSLRLARQESELEALRVGGPGEQVAAVEEADVGHASCRVFYPAGHESAALVWLHGGGWTRGSVDAHDSLARRLANRSRAAVVSVGYRLAPEHPYPAAVDDAWGAVEWATRRWDLVAVGGDSAGGNLAAAVAQRAREAHVALSLQLLVYPALDSDTRSAAYADFVRRYSDFGEIPGWGRRRQGEIESAWSAYVPDPAARSAPDASPMRTADLSGLAPASIVLAEHDILRVEGERYARRLVQAGVAAAVHFYPGQIHGFFEMPVVFADAENAIGQAAADLQRAFAGTFPDGPRNGVVWPGPLAAGTTKDTE